MPLKNNSWPSLLLGLGLLLVLVSFLFLKKWNETISTTTVLARIEDFQGQVFLTKKFESQKEKINKNLSVTSLDSIETADDSEALLEFPSAYRVRILAHSLVTLEENGNQTLLILKQGHIQVESFGREGSLMISHLGRRLSANEFQFEQQNKNNPSHTTLPTQTLNAGNTLNQGAGKSSGSLSQEDIQSTLQKHKPMFFKCYTQLLQKTPGLTGQVSFAFIIEKSGKITQPEITSSSMNDSKFRACLLEALSRVNFHAFAGDPISTVFPLRFE